MSLRGISIKIREETSNVHTPGSMSLRGIPALKTGDRSIRMVTHLDVSEGEIKEACDIVANL
jgi:hypothetical protein